MSDTFNIDGLSAKEIHAIGRDCYDGINGKPQSFEMALRYFLAALNNAPDSDDEYTKVLAVIEGGYSALQDLQNFSFVYGYINRIKNAEPKKPRGWNLKFWSRYRSTMLYCKKWKSRGA